MKIFILTMFLLISGKSHSAKSFSENFHFSAKLECSYLDGEDKEECIVSEPTEWSNQEIARTKKILTSLAKKLPSFTSKIISNGPIPLYRHKNGTIEYNGKYIKAPFNGWFDGFGIHLTDQAFLVDSRLNAYLGHDSYEHILFHELVHLFDYASNISRRADFLQLTGWDFDEAKENYILRNLDANRIEEVNQEMRMLMMNGKPFEAVQLTHEVGKKYGFPSTYGMSNVDECFAELATWIFFDPRVNEYLDPKLLKFFQLNVLK